MEAGYVTFCKVPIRLTGEAQPSKGKPVSTTAFFKIKKNSHLYLSYILVHLLGGDRVGLLYVLGTRQPSFNLPCGSVAERHGNWRAFSLWRSFSLWIRVSTEAGRLHPLCLEASRNRCETLKMVPFPFHLQRLRTAMHSGRFVT